MRRPSTAAARRSRAGCRAHAARSWSPVGRPARRRRAASVRRPRSGARPRSRSTASGGRAQRLARGARTPPAAAPSWAGPGAARLGPDDARRRSGCRKTVRPRPARAVSGSPTTRRPSAASRARRPVEVLGAPRRVGPAGDAAERVVQRDFPPPNSVPKMPRTMSWPSREVTTLPPVRIAVSIVFWRAFAAAAAAFSSARRWRSASRAAPCLGRLELLLLALDLALQLGRRHRVHAGRRRRVHAGPDRRLLGRGDGRLRGPRRSAP